MDKRQFIPRRKGWYSHLSLLQQEIDEMTRQCPTVAFSQTINFLSQIGRLRAGAFNYISLESALSDAGLIRGQVKPVGVRLNLSGYRSQPPGQSSSNAS